jgi:hypothetical protein
MPFAQQFPVRALKKLPFASFGQADGASGAPFGRPQYPYLFNMYGGKRPPWNVAGVDYRVGPPEGVILTDWRTLSNANLNVNLSTGLITFNGNYTFKNVDFSLGIGAVCSNGSGGASSITFDGCYFALPAFGSQQYGAFAAIKDTNAASIIIRNSKFDIKNYQAGISFLYLNGTVDLRYNWFINWNEQVTTMTNTAGTISVIYKYNFFDISKQSPGAHRNILQFVSTAGVPCNPLIVQFNTHFQNRGPGDSVTGAGEGIQFYNNLGAMPIPSPFPSFQNNTFISLPVPNSGDFTTGGKYTVSVSTLVHGSDPGNVTGGQNNNNYIDSRGSFFAFYPGTMTPGNGWSSTGNIDMNTGAIITPT